MILTRITISAAQFCDLVEGRQINIDVPVRDSEEVAAVRIALCDLGFAEMERAVMIAKKNSEARNG